MTVENMREFVVLAEERNYLVAADILYSTQATLSRHIIAMEEELGFTLFNRSTKKIELTQEGSRFLLYARNAIRIQEAYKAAIEQAKQERAGVLRIGYSPLVTFYHFADTITEFMTEHAEIEIKMSQASNEELTRAIHDETLELAFMQENPFEKPKNVDFSRFATDTLVAVIPKGHRLWGKKTLDLAQLKGDRFVFTQMNSEPAIIELEACRRAGFSPKIEREGMIGHAMYDWAASSGCVALDWKVPAQNFHGGGICLVDVVPPLYSNSMVIYKKQNLSSSGRKLVRFFEEHSTAEEMIEP